MAAARWTRRGSTSCWGVSAPASARPCGRVGGCRWKLRRLIAAAYQFGGVLSREELILSLATQAASLPEDDAEQLAESKAARMLGLDGERLAKLLQP